MLPSFCFHAGYLRRFPSFKKPSEVYPRFRILNPSCHSSDNHIIYPQTLVGEILVLPAAGIPVVAGKLPLQKSKLAR